jgi:uncharacterized membrane protein
MARAVPAPTTYHRWLGWHAADLRRLTSAGAVGLAAGVVLALLLPWQVAVLGAWDAAALVFLGSVWPIILHADAAGTKHLVTREDVTRDAARLLLAASCGASLVSVAFALHLAGLQEGGWRVLFIAVATLTVVVSWVVVNTVFTLRYAADYYGATPAVGAADRPGQAIDFGGTPASDRPDYRDFAYVAFTIGMTYQVSDTNLRNRRIRRTVLVHSVLSYLFGVVIVAAGVNIVAGLVS